MTTLDRATATDGAPQIWLRLVVLAFAALLGLQAVWLLLAGLIQPGIVRLPTDAAAAATAAKEQSAAAMAASLGVLRGDLWAESAFTEANLLWNDKNASSSTETAQNLARAFSNLGRALGDAPHQSGAWLLLAGLAQRFPTANVDAVEPLKMSYYTGASDRQLMPLRFRIAMQVDPSRDAEIRQFVGRELRLLLAQNQKTAIAGAYNASSPAGKRFIEQSVTDIDRSALDWLRVGAH
jgi:hypothetical protein